MSSKPEILRSGSYWKDFHQRRAERQERRAQRQTAPGAAHLVAGAVPSQPPIITFIPNRDAPVYSLAQNDGTLVLSYDPNCIRSTPPAARTNRGARSLLPARREPPPYAGSLEESRRRAAHKYNIQGPSEDEKLLARLTGCSQPVPSQKRRLASDNMT